MVKNRHDETGIPEVGFAAPGGVEVLSLARLRERAAGSQILSTPQRPTFHHLLTVGGGVLWHTVDFTGYAVAPGSWLWIRPGQVQQWQDLRPVDGTLILFQPDFLDHATAEAVALNHPHAPVLYTTTGEEREAFDLAERHLHHEFEHGRRTAPAGHVAVLRHLLAALVLRLALSADTVGSSAGEQSGVFLDFRDLLERNFATSRRVEDYAHRLGYSPRTLSRATLAVAGVNAKEFIDRRIILEAKRLLAHGNRTAAQIATQLGFADATNFSKYFQHRTGTSPIGFRAEVRGTR